MVEFLCVLCTEFGGEGGMERQDVLDEDCNFLVYDRVFCGDLHHNELHVVLL
jgi:hypothetical protein